MTVRKMIHLAAYHSKFVGFDPVHRPFGKAVGWGDPESDDGLQVGGYDYPQFMETFWHVAEHDGWLEGSYDQEEGFFYLEHTRRVEFADLEEIQRLLRFCYRGEWFCEGHWGNMVEQGLLPALLARLDELAIEAL